jgi:hypothetical protein
MMRKIKTVFGLAFTLFLFSASVIGCTCSYEGITAKGFSGQIFSVVYGKQIPDFNDPLPKAAIKLLKRIDGDDKVVAQTVADESGRFSIEKVKAGKYFLKAEFPNFDSVWVLIKIVGGSHRKKDKIIIALAPSLGCCDGYAKVQKSK